MALFLFKANSVAGGAAIAAGIVLILIGTIDRFESVKGLGVEAKLRTVDAKIAEADKILARVRNLAELTGSQIIALAAKVGRMGTSPTIAELTDIAESVKENLQQAGSSSERISQALKPWARTTALDLARRLFIPIQHALIARRDAVHAEQNAYKKITHRPETLAVQEFVRRQQAIARLEHEPIHKLVSVPIGETTSFLKRCVQDAPELEATTRASLIEGVSAWDDVFRSLANCKLSHDQKQRVLELFAN